MNIIKWMEDSIVDLKTKVEALDADAVAEVKKLIEDFDTRLKAIEAVVFQDAPPSANPQSVGTTEAVNTGSPKSVDPTSNSADTSQGN